MGRKGENYFQRLCCDKALREHKRRAHVGKQMWKHHGLQRSPVSRRPSCPSHSPQCGRGPLNVPRPPPRPGSGHGGARVWSRADSRPRGREASTVYGPQPCSGPARPEPRPKARGVLFTMDRFLKYRQRGGLDVDLRLIPSYRK